MGAQGQPLRDARAHGGWPAVRKSSFLVVGPILTILTIVPSLYWAAHRYHGTLGPDGAPLPAPYAQLGGTLFLYAAAVAIVPSLVTAVLAVRTMRVFAVMVIVLALLLAAVCDYVSSIHLSGW